MAVLAKIANSELTLLWLKLDKLFLYMFLSVEDIVPIQFESIVYGAFVTSPLTWEKNPQIIQVEIFFCSSCIFLGTDELKLEVARTCNILSSNPMLAPDQPTTPTTTGDASIQGTTNNEAPILVGYLWKKSQSASRADETANNIWYRRWFVLKRDHCLYYYKNQDVSTFLYFTITQWFN